MTAKPQMANDGGEVLWFIGTLAHMKLDGSQTGGRFALWEATLPHAAAPPLHSHPQDETFYVLDGEITAWIVDAGTSGDDSDPPEWVAACGRCGVGGVVFAPGRTPHTFRAVSDMARMLVPSTPAGIDEMARGLAGPARWPWLQPPPDGPRVPADVVEAVERKTGMVRHGPAPPPNRRPGRSPAVVLR